MRHFFGRSMLLAVVFAVPGTSAHAQYHYPAGYAGWGGWGGAHTAAGDAAYGMGNFAAGAGSYNVQTAQARSINSQTAMQMNDYMYSIETRNAKNHYERIARDMKLGREASEQTYRRIHDNPTPRDVHSGDALNAVRDDLFNPKVYSQAAQSATPPIDSQLVKNIPFEYAAQMVTETLDDLVSKGPPDVLLTSPTFGIRPPAVAGPRREDPRGAQSGSDPTDLLAEFRVALKATLDKVANAIPQGTSDRREAENYLKALYGISKMLQTPAIDQFLKGLDKVPTTDLGHLLFFMHSFNLRFGVAKTPAQEGAYDQLYPMLIALRDQVQAPVEPLCQPVAARPEEGDDVLLGDGLQPLPAAAGSAYRRRSRTAPAGTDQVSRAARSRPARSRVSRNDRVRRTEWKSEGDRSNTGGTAAIQAVLAMAYPGPRAEGSVRIPRTARRSPRNSPRSDRNETGFPVVRPGRTRDLPGLGSPGVCEGREGPSGPRDGGDHGQGGHTVARTDRRRQRHRCSGRVVHEGVRRGRRCGGRRDLRRGRPRRRRARPSGLKAARHPGQSGRVVRGQSPQHDRHRDEGPAFPRPRHGARGGTHHHHPSRGRAAGDQSLHRRLRQARWPLAPVGRPRGAHPRSDPARPPQGTGMDGRGLDQ